MEKSLNSIFKNKKILITGHTGFKGSWMCLLLNNLGANVYGFALSPPTNPSLYEVAKVEEQVISHIGNIQNFELLQSVISEIQPDAIIHMAAQALVRESYENPLETYQTNVIGTANLFQAVRNVKSVKAIVNITTDKCYENREWEWGYREIDTLGGYDPYSNSKACSELVTTSFRNSFFNPELYHEHGVAIATARAGNVIGGGDWATDRLIPDFLRAISKGEKVIIRNPLAIRPWQHVLEPLAGYLYLLKFLLTEGKEFGEAWNFGPGDSETKNVEWIVSEICNLWGENASYELDKNIHPHEARFLKLDCSKANSRLSWYPKWNIKTSLTKIVEWHKAYKQNADMKAVCMEQIDNYLYK
jgi:CDP-glucose 4,6-dehydratase